MDIFKNGVKMGLYDVVNRMEERRKRLRLIKSNLMNTKNYMSKAVLECNDADDMIKGILQVSLAINEIDDLIENIL